MVVEARGRPVKCGGSWRSGAAGTGAASSTHVGPAGCPHVAACDL